MVEYDKSGTEIDLKFFILLPPLQSTLLGVYNTHRKAPQVTDKADAIASSSRKEEIYLMGQFHHRNSDPTGAASPPVTGRQR